MKRQTYNRLIRIRDGQLSTRKEIIDTQTMALLREFAAGRDQIASDAAKYISTVLRIGHSYSQGLGEGISLVDNLTPPGGKEDSINSAGDELIAPENLATAISGLDDMTDRVKAVLGLRFGIPMEDLIMNQVYEELRPEAQSLIGQEVEFEVIAQLLHITPFDAENIVRLGVAKIKDSPGLAAAFPFSA